MYAPKQSLLAIYPHPLSNVEIQAIKTFPPIFPASSVAFQFTSSGQKSLKTFIMKQTVWCEEVGNCVEVLKGWSDWTMEYLYDGVFVRWSICTMEHLRSKWSKDGKATAAFDTQRINRKFLTGFRVGGLPSAASEDKTLQITKRFHWQIEWAGNDRPRFMAYTSSQ